MSVCEADVVIHGHAFDFFSRQRSQALQTLFLMLSWASIEFDLWEDMFL